MSLADRYRKPVSRESSSGAFSCPHYSPLPGSKRCKDYLKGGACARADEFMCVEWLKANGHAIPDNHPVVAPPAKDLFGNPVAVPPPPPAPRSNKQSRPTSPAPTAPRPKEEEEPKVIEPIPKDDVESFKALGIEVCLHSEEIGDVWIVPEYTGQERKELSIEHAATLCMVVGAFPGSKVVAFEKKPESDDRKEPA